MLESQIALTRQSEMRGSLLGVMNSGNEVLQVTAQCHQPQVASVLASLASLALTTKVNEVTLPIISEKVLADIHRCSADPEHQLWRRAFYTAFKVKDNVPSLKEHSSLRLKTFSMVNSFFERQSVQGPSLIVKGIGMEILNGILDPLLHNIPDNHLEEMDPMSMSMSMPSHSPLPPPKYIGSLREVRHWSPKDRITIALPTMGKKSPKQDLFLKSLKRILSASPVQHGASPLRRVGSLLNPSLAEEDFMVDLRQHSDCGLFVITIDGDCSITSVQRIIDSFFDYKKYDFASSALMEPKHCRTSIETCLDEYDHINLEFFGATGGSGEMMDSKTFKEEFLSFTREKPFLLVEGNLDNLASINDFTFK